MLIRRDKLGKVLLIYCSFWFAKTRCWYVEAAVRASMGASPTAFRNFLVCDTVLGVR